MSADTWGGLSQVTRSSGPTPGRLWVSIDPGADYDSTVAAVKRVVAGYPGLTRDVETYSQERVRAALTGTNQDVVVRVYGEDLQTLGRQAEKVRKALSGIDGIAGPPVLLPPEEPTLQVKVDLARAEKHGIKPGDVRRAATTLLSGLVVGSLFEQQKVFDVVVWGTPQTRNSLTAVRRLLIDTPGGGHVRLGDVADVRIGPSPGVIKRQAVSRYVDVAAAVSGRGRDAVVSDVQSRLHGLAFPIEYHAEVLAAERQPVARLISLAVAAVLGMYLLLQAFFGSWRLAALALFAPPLGAAGGALAVLAAGGTLSFGSYIALLALFGFAIRSAVLYLDRLRRLEADEGAARSASLALRAAHERLTPVVVTALATALVFLPILIMGDEPGLELLHPIAVVFVGGLITSVPFNLFVLPALYLRLGLVPASEAAGAFDDLVPAAELHG